MPACGSKGLSSPERYPHPLSRLATDIVATTFSQGLVDDAIELWVGQNGFRNGIL
jgi:hypothetical protein